MAGLILVLNAGSSTLKGSLVQPGSDQPVAAETVTWDGDRNAAVTSMLNALRAGQHDLSAVAHRVVHGGTTFTEPVVVSDEVLEELDELSELAPLHNEAALDAIRVARSALPDVPHVACFDTAFHAMLPEVAWRYPVPYDWTSKWQIRRFGFHGLSVEWSVRSAARMLDRPIGSLSVVVAHLGSGCSVTAVEGGRSAWTSMGFTPLEGLMMATRSGSIDPGLVLHLVRSGSVSADELAELLERHAGLTGVSGVSRDMREVRAAADAGNERAFLAVEMFVARAAEAIAAAMTWGRPEAIVFTGGIGEHDERTRAAIVARLGGLAPGVRILTIAAREDLVMADAAARLTAQS